MIFKELKRRWKADTPEIAKKIRNAAGVISAIVPSAWIAFSAMGIILPEWFTNHVGYITLLSLIITGYAGLQEKHEALHNSRVMPVGHGKQAKDK